MVGGGWRAVAMWWGSAGSLLIRPPRSPFSVSRLLSPPPPPTLALLDSPPFFGSGGAVTSRLLCRSTGDGADRLSFRGGSPGICLGFGRSRGVWAALRVDRRRSRAVGLLRWLRRRSSQEAQIAEEAQVSIGLVDKMGCT